MFSKVAMTKINALIKSADFLEIIEVTEKHVKIGFWSRVCTVDKFGKVVWLK